MRKLAVLATLVLAMMQAVSAGEYNGTIAGARAQADSLNKPLLLEFFAVW